MAEDVIGNERTPIYQPKKRGALSRISDGVIRLFAGLGLGGAVIFVAILAIVVFIAELILVGILTIYILTFAYGIFIDATLFVTYSIFTVPYAEVIRIGFLNPWAFWAVYIFMLLARLSKKSSNKKKECRLKEFQ